jgi:hypothetical protein
MEVKAWLRELGLERYAQDFANNDVDEHTLPNLTEGDLVEIGVKSVGHRRRLSEAIAALRLAGPPPQPTAAIAAVGGVCHRG